MQRAIYQDQFGSWNLMASGDLSDAVAPMLAAGPSQYPTVEYTWDGQAWTTQSWNMDVRASAAPASLPPQPCAPGNYVIGSSCVDGWTAGAASGVVAFGLAKLLLGTSLMASAGLGAIVLLAVSQLPRLQQPAA